MRSQNVKVQAKRWSIQNFCALLKDSYACNLTNINMKQLLAVIFLGFITCTLTEIYSGTLAQLFIKITLKQIRKTNITCSRRGEKLDLTVPLAWSSVSSESQNQCDRPWSDSWGLEGAPGGGSLSDSRAPFSQSWMVGSSADPHSAFQWRKNRFREKAKRDEFLIENVTVALKKILISTL